MEINKYLICGSRKTENPTLIENLILHKISPQSVIIEGEAYGADRIARVIGESTNKIVRKFPAEWDKYGKVAGPIRNEEMLAENPNEVHAFFSFRDQVSKGTSHMCTIAEKAEIPVFRYYADEEGWFNPEWYLQYGITDPREVYGYKWQGYRFFRDL